MTSARIEAIIADFDQAMLITENGGFRPSVLPEVAMLRMTMECALQLAIANEQNTLANVRTVEGALVVMENHPVTRVEVQR